MSLHGNSVPESGPHAEEDAQCSQRNQVEWVEELESVHRGRSVGKRAPTAAGHRADPLAKSCRQIQHQLDDLSEDDNTAEGGKVPGVACGAEWVVLQTDDTDVTS